MRLVYGGGRVGLMGIVAEAVLAGGGEVIGVIPDFLKGHEAVHTGLPDLRIVGSMHDRKRTMFELSDAFVVLPGGFGTLDESIEILTWRQLELHDKPLIFCDVDGFWQPLVGLVESLVDKGFVRPDDARLITLVSGVTEVFEALKDAPPPKVTPEVNRT